MALAALSVRKWLALIAKVRNAVRGRNIIGIQGMKNVLLLLTSELVALKLKMTNVLNAVHLLAVKKSSILITLILHVTIALRIALNALLLVAWNAKTEVFLMQVFVLVVLLFLVQVALSVLRMDVQMSNLKMIHMSFVVQWLPNAGVKHMVLNVLLMTEINANAQNVLKTVPLS